MATPHLALQPSWCSPLKLCSGSDWIPMATGRYTHLSRGSPLRLEYGNASRQRPPCYFRVSCVSKSAMRVLEEVVSTRGTNGAKLLVRRSRGLSRVAQMEVLEELLQRGQCELVLPMYEAVRQGAKFKWDAKLHARIVTMVSMDTNQTFSDLSHILEPQAALALKQEAELECALIESYMSQGLVDQANEAFRRLCDLPLARSRTLGYRALVRAYSAAANPGEAEKILRSEGFSPLLDDYKAILLGYGKLGMVVDMERIAVELRRNGMRLDTAGYNMMISAYCYVGMLERMVEVFLQMGEIGLKPSMVSWNALTKACCTLVTLAGKDRGALVTPQILLSRLQNEGASAEELNIVQLLLARGLPSECVTFSSDMWQLDMHNMSVGTASIILPLWLSSLKDRIQRNDGLPAEVKLVTGWGKHSRADVKAPVRTVIIAELEALKSPFKPDGENKGAFFTRGSSLKKWVSTLPR